MHAHTVARSVGEAVGITRRVTALQPGLVHPQAAEFVAVREEPGVGNQPARVNVGIELGQPCADAVG